MADLSEGLLIGLIPWAEEDIKSCVMVEWLWLRGEGHSSALFEIKGKPFWCGLGCGARLCSRKGRNIGPPLCRHAHSSHNQNSSCGDPVNEFSS
ncbi:hypothetical protein E2C01_091411 [Portunus trituberculatus]|uniref:Uncharacterized protein n=1 Tax=Portunus trituberculatus TaxID=210409 RepID=A0A5B7JMV9_PORTR|nr:hypothetical protein [Portunus trituberculatus]